MSKEDIDSRKTYPIHRSMLEAMGIELLIAKKEYEQQLRVANKSPDFLLVTADKVFYEDQVAYLDGLVSYLHKLTNNELLLI
jgi:hypothetical protein